MSNSQWGKTRTKIPDGVATQVEAFPCLNTTALLMSVNCISSVSELFERISLTSSEYTRELLPLVTKTYKDANSPKAYNYHRAILIHNTTLFESVSTGAHNVCVISGAGLWCIVLRQSLIGSPVGCDKTKPSNHSFFEWHPHEGF